MAQFATTQSTHTSWYFANSRAKKPLAEIIEQSKLSILFRLLHPRDVKVVLVWFKQYLHVISIHLALPPQQIIIKIMTKLLQNPLSQILQVTTVTLVMMFFFSSGCWAINILKLCKLLLEAQLESVPIQ